MKNKSEMPKSKTNILGKVSDRELQERRVESVLRFMHLPYKRQFLFHPQRKWRCDFAIIEHKILIEYEGGTFTFGGHSRGKGYSNNCKKYNETQKLGWRLLRYTSDMIRGKDLAIIIRDIKDLIEDKK